MIRPEAAALLYRWREVIACAAVAVLGLWIAATPGWIVRGFGWVLVLGAALVAIPAIRRLRFAAAEDAPGIVSIDEGRVAYMGPETGGLAALGDLRRLSLRRDPYPVWYLEHPDGVLAIPAGARGADALIDAFAQLPGIDVARLTAALRRPGTGTQVLWQRGSDAPRLT